MIRRVSLAVLPFLLAGPALGQAASDNCATATPIAGYGTFLGDNTGATLDPYGLSCYPSGGIVRGLFYDWTATANGTVYVTLCTPGTVFDSRLGIFDSAACLGFEVACNDDHDPSLGLECSTVVFQAVAGSVYKILIVGSPGDSGPYEMSITPATTIFCEPGTAGVQPCPCANPPSGPGRGCNNHGAATGGASLTSQGPCVLFPDQFYLFSTNENPTSLTVFFTGTSLTGPAGAINGAGIRCVGGLKRLYTGNASGGTIVRPGGSNPSVSARSAALGVPIQPGQTRHYFTVYRDPAAAGPCGNTASTVNTSNALSAHWGP